VIPDHLTRPGASIRTS